MDFSPHGVPGYLPVKGFSVPLPITATAKRPETEGAITTSPIALPFEILLPQGWIIRAKHWILDFFLTF
jgi:hypothetical protein